MGLQPESMILADRSNRNTEIGETICEEFFDYSDAVGTKKQYQINRKQFSETSTIEDVKTYIDNTVLTPGIYPIMMHGPKAEPWATANGLDEILDYLENTYPDTAQVSTYSYVFDTFGTYREITESTEPAFSGVGKDGYYYENGQVVGGKGLIEFEGDYYFVVYSGKIAKNTTKTIQPNQLNGLPLIPGDYEFDADGRMIKRNGIVDGYYYEKGQVVGGKGLIEFEGNYYFVVYSGKVAKNTTKTIQPYQLNGIDLKPGNYVFDADGRMIKRNGIVDGYYFEKGQVVGGKGLIEFEGNYYFVVYSGKVAKNTTKTIQPYQLNGIDLKPGNYVFDADGRMVKKNGVVDGYYYENGQVVGGKGLIEFEGDYYFVVYSGKVAKNTTKTIQPYQLNGIDLKPGNYVFDADGRMVKKNGVVDGYYYENGQVVGGKGLIKFEGDYYFVVYSGKIAVNTTKAVQPPQTNGLLDSGYYYFGEDGKLDFNH